MDATPIPVLVFFGPTASGKTGLLLDLFSREGDIQAEVVSADSMQVYRGMDIGTAKPSTRQRATLPHHLIDIRSPNEQFNVGDFVRLADEACLQIAGYISKNELCPQNTDSIPKNKLCPQNTDSISKNELCPQNTDSIPKNKLCPQNTDSIPKNELCPQQENDFLGDRAHKLPIVSGGTGFYLKNFIMGLSEAPQCDPEIRAILKQELREKGVIALIKELAASDPESVRRIHINDEYRLLRALEVQRSCGCPLSSFNVNVKEKRAHFHFIIIGLSRPREELYRRINLRCAQMFEQGLADEVRSLYDAGYTPDDPGLRAIGYREFFIEDPDEPRKWPDRSRVIRWRLSKDIKGVQELVARNSRRYAKRQLTFFAGIPDVKWIECGGKDSDDCKVEIEHILRTELEFLNRQRLLSKKTLP